MERAMTLLSIVDRSPSARYERVLYALSLVYRVQYCVVVRVQLLTQATVLATWTYVLAV